MEETKKCSSIKHNDKNAISYCKNCKLYLCNKCHNLHSENYQNHIFYILDKDSKNIFINECEVENHDKLDLNFFCQNHNVLCCAYCVNKINKFNYGKHFNCDFCHIMDIKEEKIKKLEENINILEDLSKNKEKIFDELKIIIEKANKNKEDLKLEIQKFFTKIRNFLNEKEDKLILEVDELYNNIYNIEDLMKVSEKISNKIKLSLEKGKLFEKEKIDNNLGCFINECIYIENTIKQINIMIDVIKKYQLNKIKSYIFCPKKGGLEILLNHINNLGGIISEDEALYNDFDINLKNPIHILKNHSSNVWCLTYLNDGRLSSCSNDNTIIIYNKKSFDPDLIIKEHLKPIYYINQLSSGLLASCSCDSTIKLFKINENKYETIQTLSYHAKTVFKLIELKNKNLISCSDDGSIIFYTKDKSEFKKDFSISHKCRCSSIIETKDNEICYSLYCSDRNIFFYNLLERKNKASLSNISKCNNQREWFIMISKDLLLIPGEKKISIIDINRYKLIRIIDVPNSNWLCGAILLNKNMLLTADDTKIIQWKIENDNLLFNSQKENAHNGWINVLIKSGDGHIVSGSDDNTIKIW